VLDYERAMLRWTHGSTPGSRSIRDVRVGWGFAPGRDGAQIAFAEGWPTHRSSGQSPRRIGREYVERLDPRNAGPLTHTLRLPSACQFFRVQVDLPDGAQRVGTCCRNSAEVSQDGHR